MKQSIKNLGLILFVFCLSACSSLIDLGSEQAPERVYLLKPYLVNPIVDTNGSNLLQRDITVTVAAAPGLDTNKILILEPDAHLNHYASARWPDYSTEVFVSLLSNSLQSSGRYNKVNKQPSASGDVLSLEIKELYTLSESNSINERSAKSVRVVLQGHLDCNASTTVGSSSGIKLSSDVAVSQNKLSEIVRAYQGAVNKISQQLLEQVANCGP